MTQLVDWPYMVICHRTESNRASFIVLGIFRLGLMSRGDLCFA